MNEINELQVYSSNLLLSLNKYDKATSPEARKSAMAEVEKQTMNFNELRENFEDIFSKTRILNNPGGYMPDQNQHRHLANGTINNDWMFVYELAMNDRLKKWFTEK
jgi:hypothetical protein